MSVIVKLMTAAFLVLVSCGEATDSPEDCAADEFFEEARQVCLLCPSVSEPQCRPGCGFEVVEDDRGCPAARCVAACDLCPEGEEFSDETFTCEPADGDDGDDVKDDEMSDDGDAPDDGEDTPEDEG